MKRPARKKPVAVSRSVHPRSHILLGALARANCSMHLYANIQGGSTSDQLIE